LMIAFFFMVTIASTFLSWYVASLHVAKNNLIAIDVLNFGSILMLSLAAYCYYRTKPLRASANGLIAIALVMEMVAFICLIVSPTAAGTDGTLVQTALYVPLMAMTVSAMSR
jgi:hypothetical protein